MIDNIRRALEALASNELSYVMARSKTKTRDEAFKGAGISKSAFYEWPAEKQAALDDLALAIKRNRLIAAEPKLNDAIEEAVDVLIELMRTSQKDNVRLAAAQTIIERVMGKPTQPVEHSGGVQFVINGLPDESNQD